MSDYSSNLTEESAQKGFRWNTTIKMMIITTGFLSLCLERINSFWGAHVIDETILTRWAASICFIVFPALKRIYICIQSVCFSRYMQAFQNAWKSQSISSCSKSRHEIGSLKLFSPCLFTLVVQKGLLCSPSTGWKH